MERKDHNTDRDNYGGGGSSRFTNLHGVQNQAGTQHIEGSVYHGPVYSTYVAGSFDTPRPGHYASSTRCDPQAWRQQCLDSLGFSQMDLRRDTIRTAHTSTCQWLLDSVEVQQWLNKEMLKDHNGFLWIKGKPGSGKSTIMKFAMTHAKKKNPKAAIVSFFFNARGEMLEKSISGMYRSLLAQILTTYPQLQRVLDECTAQVIRNGWHLEVLKDLIRCTVRQLGERNLICFVDALDECDEDETRDMVEFFEDLGRMAFSSAIQFRTCFSSRHYPHISIEKSLNLVLDSQGGHHDDLSTYLTHELRIGRNKQADEIRQELLKRSSGIFLWVALVVRILNKEFDRGRIHALRRRLDDIPDDLEALFHDILTRDGPPNRELVLCVQWVLFARRPLQPDELYSAVLFEIESNHLDTEDIGNVSRADIARFLLHASKGLIEETKVKVKSTVQFIHESVRDFFLKGHRLPSSFLGPRDTFAAHSHNQITRTCFTYYRKAGAVIRSDSASAMLSVPLLDSSPLLKRIQQKKRLQQDLPLLSYSVRNLLFHCEKAFELGIPQHELMGEFDLQQWFRINSQIHITNAYTLDVSLLYLLAAENLPYLLADELQRVPTMDIVGGEHRYPFFAAQANKCQKSLQVLLHPQSCNHNNKEFSDIDTTPADVAEALAILSEARIDVEEGCTPLYWAIQHDFASVVRCLLSGGKADTELIHFNVDNSLSTRAKVLEVALARKCPNTVRFLSTSRRDGIKISDTIARSGAALVPWALDHGLITFVRLLIAQEKFDANSLFRCSKTPISYDCETLLHYALRNSDTETLDLLLSRKDIDLYKESMDDDLRGMSPLEYVFYSMTDFETIKKLESNKAFEVNKQCSDGQTLLQKSILNRRLDFLSLILIRNDVEVTLEDGANLRRLQDEIAGRADTADKERPRWSQASRREDVASMAQVYRSHRINLDELASTQDIHSLLSDPTFNVNARNSCGETLLHSAVMLGDVQVVDHLLNHQKFCVNETDDTFRTPLHVAMDRGASLAVIERLICHQAVNINSKDLAGRTALHRATRLEDPNVLALLLARADVEVNVQDRVGFTPLTEATLLGISPGILEQLQSYGATYVNEGDCDGRTSLNHAVRRKNKSLVDLLLGEDPEWVDQTSTYGYALLDEARGRSVPRTLTLPQSRDRLRRSQLDTCSTGQC